MNTKPSHQTQWDAKKGQWVTVGKSNSKPPKVYPQGSSGTPPGEPIKDKTLVADGWVYRDLPRMTTEAMDILLGVIGEGNYEFLTFAECPDKEHGKAVRGQVMISPLGMENLILHASKSKESNGQT